jgi:hypothetical protein
VIELEDTRPARGTRKLAIRLTEEQIGPFPVSVEWLWFDQESGNFRLKNIPFFVDEVSFDDLVSLVEVELGLYQIGEVIEPSENSTVWLLTKDEAEGQKFLDEISRLGCGVEGGVLHGYYAINVPGAVSFDAVMAILTPAEDAGSVSIDYPSIRHAGSA